MSESETGKRILSGASKARCWDKMARRIQIGRHLGMQPTTVDETTTMMERLAREEYSRQVYHTILESLQAATDAFRSTMKK